MFIIFGWGRETIKDLGPVEEHICPNCRNKKYWHLIQLRKWFSLFFIPLIPYEGSYSLLCPICKQGISLDEKEFNKLKLLVENRRILALGSRGEIDRINNNLDDL